jgi:hypothetical protein
MKIKMFLAPSGAAYSGENDLSEDAAPDGALIFLETEIYKDAAPTALNGWRW